LEITIPPSSAKRRTLLKDLRRAALPAEADSSNILLTRFFGRSPNYAATSDRAESDPPGGAGQHRSFDNIELRSQPCCRGDQIGVGVYEVRCHWVGHFELVAGTPGALAYSTRLALRALFA
jgi:hypothetical protein